MASAGGKLEYISRCKLGLLCQASGGGTGGVNRGGGSVCVGGGEALFCYSCIILATAAPEGKSIILICINQHSNQANR